MQFLSPALYDFSKIIGKGIFPEFFPFFCSFYSVRGENIRLPCNFRSLNGKVLLFAARGLVVAVLTAALVGPLLRDNPMQQEFSLSRFSVKTP